MSIKRFAAHLIEKSLLLGALLIAAGLSGLTTMRVVLTSQEVVVPSLIGQRIPEAGALAARQRLLLRVEGKRHDPKVPRDSILAQDPQPGANLKAHRSVRVWVSQGPQRIAVPPLEGESLRTSRLKLEQAQIPIDRVAEVTDAAEPETVLLQYPAAGEIDSVGAGVSLLVSRGPSGRDYVMPDLIGRPLEDALEILRRAGLKTGDVRYRSYPGVAPGVVLRHAPPAGHRVSPQTAVSLEVSRAAS